MCKTFVHKEIQQPNEAQAFRRLSDVKRHMPNGSETSGSVSLIFKSNFFSSLCGILGVKRYFCHAADYPSILIAFDLQQC